MATEDGAATVGQGASVLEAPSLEDGTLLSRTRTATENMDGPPAPKEASAGLNEVPIGEKGSGTQGTDENPNRDEEATVEGKGQGVGTVATEVAGTEGNGATVAVYEIQTDDLADEHAAAMALDDAIQKISDADDTLEDATTHGDIKNIREAISTGPGLATTRGATEVTGSTSLLAPIDLADTVGAMTIVPQDIPGTLMSPAEPPVRAAEAQQPESAGSPENQGDTPPDAAIPLVSMSASRFLDDAGAGYITPQDPRQPIEGAVHLPNDALRSSTKEFTNSVTPDIALLDSANLRNDRKVDDDVPVTIGTIAVDAGKSVEPEPVTLSNDTSKAVADPLTILSDFSTNSEATNDDEVAERQPEKVPTAPMAKDTTMAGGKYYGRPDLTRGAAPVLNETTPAENTITAEIASSDARAVPTDCIKTQTYVESVVSMPGSTSERDGRNRTEVSTDCSQEGEYALKSVVIKVSHK